MVGKLKLGYDSVHLSRLPLLQVCLIGRVVPVNQSKPSLTPVSPLHRVIVGKLDAIRVRQAIKASAIRIDNQRPLQPLGLEEVVHPIALGTRVSQKFLAISPGIARQRSLMKLPDDFGLTRAQADPMPVDGDLPIAMAVGEVFASLGGRLGSDERFQPRPLGSAQEKVLFLECLRSRTLRDVAVLLGLRLEVLDCGAAVLQDQMSVPVPQIHKAGEI